MKVSMLVNTKSTHKGVNQCSKYVTQVQQQRPESPTVTTVTLTWHACKYKVHKLHQRYILRIFVKVEVDVLGLPVPNSPYGLCGL